MIFERKFDFDFFCIDLMMEIKKLFDDLEELMKITQFISIVKYLNVGRVFIFRSICAVTILLIHNWNIIENEQKI
jgi:hypothetical protein